ncbi:hypothetical protein GH714_011661 [Hevea brasiliensis]|uniref:Uncharacterized protein n=1 Tax=Hevea brasiliensis TaxID=3981 RepID=A0A6A6L154_HEVBR|nr:hypothetical protein GH714_011661 [Hevea brasiliensis]
MAIDGMGMSIGQISGKRAEVTGWEASQSSEEDWAHGARGEVHYLGSAIVEFGVSKLVTEGHPCVCGRLVAVSLGDLSLSGDRDHPSNLSG